MKREIPREPAVTFHYTSIRHYQDDLNFKTFNRAAQLVGEMIQNAPEEKLKLLAEHLANCQPEPLSSRETFDTEGAQRALVTFFKFGA